MIWLMALVAVLWMIAYLVDSAKMSSNQTLSQYECGFETISWAKNAPSLHFSKIGLIFIVFDLEMLFIISMFNYMMWSTSVLILVFIWVTLWMEYLFHSLSWFY